MSKLFSHALAVFALAFPVVALADTTITLTANQILSLDTGKVVTTGGDLKWDGTNLNPQGSATATDLTGAASSLYASLTQSTISDFAEGLSSTPFAPASGDLVIAKTNGGNYSKINVVSITGSSINLTFNTFGGSSSTPGGPTITAVVNNYSYIPTGFPNSGIAPGTIFLIYGTGMSTAPAQVALASSAGSGIPKSLEGATLSVTSGGVTVQPAMYYATPTQIAAVLPSGTHTGSATITVTYNNATSNAFSFQVVPYALGLNTYFGSGTGLLLATDNLTGSVLTYTNSAKPGETIVLYGSGLGADTADSDTVFTSTPHAVNTPLQIYIGGVAATVVYAGSSGYPGYDQIDITIPADVPQSCYVGLAAVTGTGSSLTVSNFGSLPVSQSGGECNDSVFGISGTTISTLSGQGTVSYGDVFIGQLTEPAIPPQTGSMTENIASAIFDKETGASFGTSSGSVYSIGSCFVTQVISVSGSLPTFTGLDAGNISLTGPAGSYTLSSFSKGEYVAELPAGAITSSGGAFTYNGSGGADVGSFKATINLPNPLLNWTNQSAAATINRASGVTVNWTGGGPGTYVIISGSSSDSTTGANGSFTCLANQSAGSFAVPGYVTSTLPAGTGGLTVENAASYSTFTASGLDFGITFGFTGTEVNSTYQ